MKRITRPSPGGRSNLGEMESRAGLVTPSPDSARINTPGGRANGGGERRVLPPSGAAAAGGWAWLSIGRISRGENNAKAAAQRGT